MADTESPPSLLASTADEADLLASLRAGDEQAFARLVDSHHASMVRLAMVYVPSRAVAEEVAQEAWLAVLHGLDRFEGRSSLKTWIFRILMNRAMTRGQREHRTIPFSPVFDASKDPMEPAVDPDRFRPPGEKWAGSWGQYPRGWEGAPEARLLSRESLGHVSRAIEKLPPSQREVITLRDVDGWSSREVCNALGITETNQRVLLHRARSKVRRAMEQYLDERA
ncbi:MAG TPA: sigma-70 family RNA polymerase sigma factor [Actinomycetota bacterium]|jgi:RNA polymerase sigma-70 factor (ECF subfamily)|nr:sigma-70 family RNA polymerase sigma factor [Actinomycetota bacterium]